MGIQATGKSTFYAQRFAETHVHISLDMLKTRHREARLLEVCVDTQQPFVIDNTNPSKGDRQRYILAAHSTGMTVVGYYFESAIEAALTRNASRSEAKQVPEVGVRGTHSRLELPSKDEGFDELHYVRLADGRYEVEAWQE